MTQLNPSTSSILIIGAGTWGTSTALHLARRGYKNVTVLDPHPVPSPISAGNDINKIVEHGTFTPAPDSPPATVSDSLLTAATHAWLTDPLFTPFYHPTGYICAATSPAALESISPTPDGAVPVDTAEAFRATMPPGVLTGEFPDWRGWHKKEGAGWCHARKALTAAAKEAERLGVVFVSGEGGKVVEVVKEEGGRVTGARTADGRVWRADRTVLAAGASAPQLVELRGQLRPTAWTLCHVPLGAEEAGRYRDLPVLFHVERGFFMEPDEERHELKVCDEHPGYLNWVKDEATGEWASRPFRREQIPREAEERARGFLRECMPQLAERELSFARICWCADTPDRNFLVAGHPDHENLLLAVGASGHGFMQIPVIGKYIADALEGRLEERMRECWRWRPETAVGRDWRDTLGRFGGGDKVMDFQDVGEGEWTTIKPRE